MPAAIVAISISALWLTARLLPAPPLLDGVAFSGAVTDREGKLLRLQRAKDGIFRLRTSIEDISPHLIEATIAYEDRYFYQHPGINVLSILRAAIATVTGDRPIGASTLTMQVARMRFGLHTRSLAGKIEQMFWALRLEAHYNKEAILSAYFNLTPYGGNIEGAGAAAQIYFHKNAIDINRSEALALSVIPQNPNVRRPGSFALNEAYRRQAAKDAQKNALLLVPREAPAMYGIGELPFLAPHYAQRLLKQFPDQTVRGSLSWPLQRQMQDTVTAAMARLRPWGIRNAALLVADWRSGEVLSYIGSANFFDRTIDGQVDGLQAPRSPGSTLKTFIYALALDQGLIHPQTILIDKPQSFGGYRPENADGSFRGPISAAQALIASRNIPALALEEQLHPDLYAFLLRAGISLPYDRAHYGLSIALGGAEIRPFDVGTLYLLLGRGGVVSPLRLALEPSSAQERTASSALLSKEACWIVGRMLSERGEQISVHGKNIDLLYKTGTSNGFRDAWAAGLVGPYVIVIWCGNFDGSPNPNLQGATVAAPLFREVARRIFSHNDRALPPRDDLPPPGLHVVREMACRATGDLAAIVACRDQVPTWFIPGVSPMRDRGVLREIFVNGKTGLRTCRIGPDVKRMLWEFWPADYQRLFRQAGIIKAPPPPWENGCAEQAQEGTLHIVSPSKNTVLYEGTGARKKATVILRASAEGDVSTLYWFAGARFLGAVSPQDPLTAELPAGTWTITVVDDQDRRNSLSFEVRHP